MRAYPKRRRKDLWKERHMKFEKNPKRRFDTPLSDWDLAQMAVLRPLRPRQTPKFFGDDHFGRRGEAEEADQEIPAGSCLFLTKEYDQALSQVDAVYLVLPKSSAPRIRVGLAKRRVHVLCEKPMAVD